MSGWEPADWNAGGGEAPSMVGLRREGLGFWIALQERIWIMKFF